MERDTFEDPWLSGNRKGTVRRLLLVLLATFLLMMLWGQWFLLFQRGAPLADLLLLPGAMITMCVWLLLALPARREAIPFRYILFGPIYSGISLFWCLIVDEHG